MKMFIQINPVTKERYVLYLTCSGRNGNHGRICDKTLESRGSQLAGNLG